MLNRKFLLDKIFFSGSRWLCPLPFYGSLASTSGKLRDPKPLPPGLSGRSLFSRNVPASPFSLGNMQISCIGRMCGFSSETSVVHGASGLVDVALAQTGEGIAECEILKCYVSEGDHIDEFQPLCEVQSDKATMEITSRYKGVVSQVFHVPGDIVKVGEILLKILVEESHARSVPCDGSESLKSLDTKTCDSRGCYTSGVLSTPVVRNLAKEIGVNINDVPGTGKDSRVLKEDVLHYSVQKGIFREPSSSENADSTEHILGREGTYQSASSVHGWHYEDKIVPLSGFQRSMVKSMTKAVKIPHFHYVEEINCDALVELKVSFQMGNSDPEVKHTFLPLLIKSLSVALSNYPLMNSCFIEESAEVILRGSHNIGIAMATAYGLVVPNIKKVQSLSIWEITMELARLQKLASDNKLSPEDISGGTLTLSNIGSVGGKMGFPLLNVPEVSIIALGRIQKVPQIGKDGIIAATSIMNVDIGADHRVLDGATVARFCNEWKRFIENPDLVMLHMR